MATKEDKEMDEMMRFEAEMKELEAAAAAVPAEAMDPAAAKAAPSVAAKPTKNVVYQSVIMKAPVKKADMVSRPAVPAGPTALPAAYGQAPQYYAGAAPSQHAQPPQPYGAPPQPYGAPTQYGAAQTAGYDSAQQGARQYPPPHQQQYGAAPYSAGATGESAYRDGGSSTQRGSYNQPGSASSSSYGTGANAVPVKPKLTRGGKKRYRAAGGKVWVDESLSEWPEDDFRIFVGDLGNEVTDGILAAAFDKYKSFAKAKVVRDKHNRKSKGYGFVSFIDPFDMLKALKEMNGKYCGNRPMKLKKSTWKEREVKGGRKKIKKLFKNQIDLYK